MTLRVACVLAGLSLSVVACGDDDTMTDAGGADTADTGSTGTPTCGPLPAEPTRTCEALASDYAPGGMSMWPACISDDGTYHRIEDTISTIRRVEAYEDIAALLFDGTPTSDDFLAARMIYQEDEGLDSRVVRRYDPRFEAPDGTDCTQDGVPAMFPDYCVGPAQIQPILLSAFAAGIAGNGDARVHAARIQGALLWFLYASVSKEGFTCTTKAKDCDSAYAYYTGGREARGGIGLAGAIASVDPDAHDRAWDGVFALRCWRDLDDADTAVDLELRDRARAQLDRAVTDGVSAVVRAAVEDACDDSARWAFVQVLGRALFHNARANDATSADVIEDAVGTDDGADAVALMSALDTAFVCP